MSRLRWVILCAAIVNLLLSGSYATCALCCLGAWGASTMRDGSKYFDRIFCIIASSASMVIWLHVDLVQGIEFPKRMFLSSMAWVLLGLGILFFYRSRKENTEPEGQIEEEEDADGTEDADV